jgi:competence protein ComEA
VNINTADAAALETLAGVGPSLAARIIAWREQNGPFRSVDELTAVSGIGPKTLDGMRDQVTV